MKNIESSVDDYLLDVPSERLAAMEKLRTLFQQELKGYVEQMSYGVPCYAKDGIILAGFTSQKHFIGVYILLKSAFNKHIITLKHGTPSKGLIQFTNPDCIHFDVIQQMLKSTYESVDKVSRL